MRRWMKRIGIICLIPVVLVILISILLYIPPLQNFAVRLATEYASETTGMNIGIGQIRLSFPLNLTIRDVKVITPPDTLLSLESFQAVSYTHLVRSYWPEFVPIRTRQPMRRR